MSVTWVTSRIAKASLIAELLQLRFMRDRRNLGCNIRDAADGKSTKACNLICANLASAQPAL
jgi:hypothetical protein